MNKYLSESSFQQTARANRERLFAERPPILNEEEKRATAVRQNMARLRELRLAKEAEGSNEIVTGNQPAKAKQKKRFR